MSGSTIRRNVNRGKTCAREERRRKRRGDTEDEGKSLNTRNNNAAGDKTAGMEMETGAFAYKPSLGNSRLFETRVSRVRTNLRW